MENFNEVSKYNAAVLAARYMDDKLSVCAFSRTTESRYIVTFGSGHQEWWNHCDREDVIGNRFSRIDEQYWEPCSVALSGYYDMVGLWGCKTPYYLKTVMGIGGEKSTVTVTTVPNPELWCFAPDFHEALAKLQEQEQS